MCVFWGVKYTRGVWMAAGSSAGFDTLSCERAFYCCVFQHLACMQVCLWMHLHVRNATCDLLHTEMVVFQCVCVCACGGCWRMYGLQLWWASRQAFPSPSSLLCSTSPHKAHRFTACRENKRNARADWED